MKQSKIHNLLRRNKFNANRVEYKGMKFDSKKELNRYLVLLDMEKNGLISQLKRQAKFTLISKNRKFDALSYIADFTYFLRSKNKKLEIFIVEDVKGYKKGSAYAVFKIKQKLMYHTYGIYVQEV